MKLMVCMHCHAAMEVDAAMDVDVPPVDAAEATDASEQLRAIARVLNVPTGAGQQHAAPLLAAVNEKARSMLESLPHTFFAPLLPPGSLSTEQVCLATLHALLFPACGPVLGPCGTCHEGGHHFSAVCRWPPWSS